MALFQRFQVHISKIKNKQRTAYLDKELKKTSVQAIVDEEKQVHCGKAPKEPAFFDDHFPERDICPLEKICLPTMRSKNKNVNIRLQIFLKIHQKFR